MCRLRPSGATGNTSCCEVLWGSGDSLFFFSENLTRSSKISEVFTCLSVNAFQKIAF